MIFGTILLIASVVAAGGRRQYSGLDGDYDEVEISSSLIYEDGTSDYRYARPTHRTQRTQHRTQHALTATRHSKRNTTTLKKRTSGGDNVPSLAASGDVGFLKKLGQFRSNLFFEGDRMEKLLEQVLATGGETHMTKTPIAKWLPIEVPTITFSATSNFSSAKCCHYI